MAFVGVMKIKIESHADLVRPRKFLVEAHGHECIRSQGKEKNSLPASYDRAQNQRVAPNVEGGLLLWPLFRSFSAGFPAWPFQGSAALQVDQCKKRVLHDNVVPASCYANTILPARCAMRPLHFLRAQAQSDQTGATTDT